MNIPMLRAYVQGYQEHLFDLQCLAVHQGYWAGYYRSRKPKSAKTILNRMVREHEKAVKKASGKSKYIPKPEVDLDRFMQLEAKRMEYIARGK